jgi:glucose/arabinose dehydrogenase
MPHTARRYAVAAVSLVAVAALVCACRRDGNAYGPEGTGTFPALALERAFPALNFRNPVLLLQAPGDSTRWFVVERGGQVLAFPNDAGAAPAPLKPVLRIAVNTAGEGGLLGMAFHPNYPVTPHAFLSYTRSGPDSDHPLTSVVARFTSRDGGTTLDAASEDVLLTLDQPYANHNGGHIAFDSAGKLFIGFGDGGSGNDPLNYGQNLNVLFGKLLRIDVDAAPAMGKRYAIPADNPFAAGGGAPENFAWGLRNPWRWSFDRANGRLWLGDVGQSRWEEVNVIERGRNYGWRPCEGAHRRGGDAPCANPAYTDPVAEYDHGHGCSVTGGHVYRGARIPALAGAYLFGDFCSGTIWALRETGGGATVVEPVIRSGLSIVSFGQEHDGEVYVVDFSGTLQRVIPKP